MGFWVVLAQIVKTILTVKKYANFLTALSDKKLVEGVLTTVLTQGIIKAIADRGIPLDKVHPLVLAEEWADSTLKLAPSYLPGFGLIVAADKLMEQLSIHTDHLLKGKAVAGGITPNHNVTRTADPVILFRGEFERAVSDLEVNGAGMNFNFRRIYRSRTSYVGPLGFNWDHSYNQRLRQDNEFVLTRLTGELTEVSFIKHPRFGETEFSYYAPPNGIHDVIVPDNTGTFLLKRPQGITYYYEPAMDAGEYRLRRIEDRFGNFLAFSYSSEDHLDRVFVNSASRYVHFEYDELDRLIRIEDHAGRFVTYTYNEWGYLDCVIGPALAGKEPAGQERYEYDQVGEVRKLVRVYDWKHRVLVENEYEKNPLSEYFGYIIRQTENRGETTFFYDSVQEQFDPALPPWDRPTLHVWESKRNGHQVEHISNDLGNELLTREQFVERGRIREAVTRFRYNAGGQIIARMDPNGTLTQYLFARDHLAETIPWPDIDHVLGDVPMKSRMSFGNLLAVVTRGHRVAISAAPLDPNFWEQGLPSVKKPDHPDDVVAKYSYSNENQLLLSTSDPRYTVSADPLHVESANPGDPTFDPTDPLFIDHQGHLTRFEYGSGPRYELQRTRYPDRTRPSSLDGVTAVTDIVREVRQYDAGSHPLEEVDARGYIWLNEYYDATSGPKEGFLRRRLIPHVDLTLDGRSPEILEIQKQGSWQAFDRFLRSGGTVGDTIQISFEGVRIALFQSRDPVEHVTTNTQVMVTLDGTPQAAWNQLQEANYIISNLPPGNHVLKLTDQTGSSIAIGRIRSHVSLEYEVNDLGHVLKEIDARGNMTEYIVDVLGRKTRETHGPSTNPSVVQFEYDLGRNLMMERTEWRDEAGQNRPEIAVVKRYHYDKSGLLLFQSEGPEQGGNKRIIRYRYDPEDNLRETVNLRGERTYFDYDALNRQIRAVRAACSPDCSVITTTYDLADQILAQRKPRNALHLNGYVDAGGEWQSGINTRGQVRVKTDPLGHMTVMDYDALDNPTVVRRFQRRQDGKFELLARQTTDYDEHSDIIRETVAVFQQPILTADPVHNPDMEFLAAVNTGEVQNATTEYHLDADGNVVAIRFPDGAVLRQRYDGQDRAYDQIDAEGRRTFRCYDGNGNISRIYAFEPVYDTPSGNLLHHDVFIQEHEYDELDREITRIDAYGNRWQLQYDTLGNNTLAIDPLGNRTRFEHNAFGEEVRHIQERTQTGLGGGPPLPALETQREYDENGNIIVVIDPLNRRTEFKYDALGRLVEFWFAISPNEPKELRKYDTADNLVSITDRNGLVRTMHYDLLNRHTRTEIDTSGLTSGSALSPVTADYANFEYDAGGNRIRHENNYCAVKIERDSRGLPIAEKITFQNIAGAPGPLEIIRRFDVAGNRTKLVYPSGREVVYTYDHLGRVTSVTNLISPADYPGRAANAAGVQLAGYTYVGRRLVNTELGNNLTLSSQFDGRGYMLEQRVDHTTGMVWRLQLLRDAAGYVRVENAITRTGTRSRKVALDSIYQLVHYQDASAKWIDPVGLAPPHSPIAPDQVTSQMAIDTSIGPLELPTGSFAFKYDQMGNRLETHEVGLASFSSTPNVLNQYDQVDAISWQYDPNGNLRSDGEHLLKYDLNNALQEVEKVATAEKMAIYYRNALGRVVAETTSTGTVFRVYDDLLPLVELTPGGRTEITPGHYPNAVLHAAKGGEDYWLVHDELRSLRLLSDGSGKVVSMPLFRPFGAPEDNELASSALPFGFAGMLHTFGLPFYHSDRRSYRADVGRHLQRDPAGFVDNLNLYIYASNNPVNFFDMTGLKATSTSRDTLLLDVLETILVGAAGAALAWFTGGLAIAALPSLGLEGSISYLGFEVSKESLFKASFAVVGGANGLISGARGIYNWESPLGWAAFFSDSTWGLVGTALGDLVHLVNIGWGQYNRSDSRRKNRHVYDSGIRLEGRLALTMGNVINNMQVGGADLLEHETLHVWQSRIFGALYQGLALRWYVTGGAIGLILGTKLAIEGGQSIFKSIEDVAYYENPWELWAYSVGKKTLRQNLKGLKGDLNVMYK